MLAVAVRGDNYSGVIDRIHLKPVFVACFSDFFGGGTGHGAGVFLVLQANAARSPTTAYAAVRFDRAGLLETRFSAHVAIAAAARVVRIRTTGRSLLAEASRLLIPEIATRLVSGRKLSCKNSFYASDECYA